MLEVLTDMTVEVHQAIGAVLLVTGAALQVAGIMMGEALQVDIMEEHL